MVAQVAAAYAPRWCLVMACEHPNPRPKADRIGNVDVYCPACKLTVTQRQMSLAAAYSRVIREAREAAQVRLDELQPVQRYSQYSVGERR